MIIPPAGLIGNWESELRTLFSLDFRIIGGSDSKADNPFRGPNSDCLIVSVDTLAGERTFARLQEQGIEPYDLCIFDEVHKLSADRQPDYSIRRTDRYRVAEALAGVPAGDPRWSLDWSSHHILLLTATPHMGEESPKAGQEENELAEHKAMGGVVAVSLAELIAERKRVEQLSELAKRVGAKGDESKFEKLREVLEDPEGRDEKLIIFTEHRDTLDYLVRRLEGLGFAGRVAQIHGGMEFRKREEQIEFFRKQTEAGGALYLVCTDATGEGINLQFAWRLLNWDIPWNPARLEQRMGRIHRYKQQHDPIIIINLIAEKTREGRVMMALLDKLERIRKTRLQPVWSSSNEATSIRNPSLPPCAASSMRRSGRATQTPRSSSTASAIGRRASKAAGRLHSRPWSVSRA